MLLQNKHALVFAASGVIASAVARRFAAEGATLWLSAKSTESIAALADELTEAGAVAHVAAVDATGQAAVDVYVDTIAASSTIDVVFNGIGGRPAELGYPASIDTISIDSFTTPIRRIAGSQFLTARAAARHMAPAGRGSIVTLSATLSSMTASHMSNISAACGAVEAMTRSLAGELGPSGVRVNCVRASAMPETRTITDTAAGLAGLGEQPSFLPPPLRRPITLAETAGAAAFLASDQASGMTGQVITVCAGAFVG
jgi:NAD(P)-dependent dehydrogenase (short-subunit alcohol dehydrogenase family)